MIAGGEIPPPVRIEMAPAPIAGIDRGISAMGAKTAMLAYVDAGCNAAAILASRPVLDRDACRAALARLFPTEKFDVLPDVHLADVYPPDDEVVIGCFHGLTIVATPRLIANPSEMDERYLDFANGRTMLYHVMISSVSAFAYGVWEQGALARSLSMNNDEGVGENIGAPRAFELPFWAGEHRYEGEEALFDALDIAEAALLDMFGYMLEGAAPPDQIDPESIPLMCFARKKPRWKFW